MMKKIKDVGNDGFSLVELIIVMAIGVIITAALAAGLSLLSSRPVDECARKIEIALEGNRNTTMGKLSANISFYVDSNDNIMIKEIIDNGDPYIKQIGDNVVDVCYYIEGNSNPIYLTNNADDCTISFNRSSGSLNPLSGGAHDGNIVTSFVVSRGDRKITVNIDKLTGRVELAY